MAAIFERVKRVLLEEIEGLSIPEDRIVPQTRLSDLGINEPLWEVQALSGLEREFGEEGEPFLIPDDDFALLETVGEVVGYFRFMGFRDDPVLTG